MSRTMQVRISIVPFFRPSFKVLFPKLHRYLQDSGVEVNDYKISLYHLIRELERLLYRPDLNKDFKNVIEKYLPPLASLKKAVEEMIANTRAKEIDPLLYQIEDIFSDLERDLF